MLFKSLEFKNAVGQKVKIMEIPVLMQDSPYYFMIQIRLRRFLSMIYAEKNEKRIFSFKEYLKRVLKWPDYKDLFLLS